MQRYGDGLREVVTKLTDSCSWVNVFGATWGWRGQRLKDKLPVAVTARILTFSHMLTCAGFFLNLMCQAHSRKLRPMEMLRAAVYGVIKRS